MAGPIKPKAQTGAEKYQIGKASKRRKDFEAANPERFQGVETLPGHVTHKQTYRDMNIGVQKEAGENSTGQMALPGMDHPAEVNTPERWEDMHPSKKARVLRNAAKFGVTPESAHRALGAQVDQGALREGRLGQRHASFYAAEGHQPGGEMTPRTRLITSAKENGVPFEQQAIANSVTSPKTKFAVTPKSGPNEGVRVYPNDMHATQAIHYAQEHRPSEARAAAGVGGMHTNVKRASLAVENMQYGASAKEAWKAGPKTGPYHNSWVDPHGPNQFWVSDIHSGGGGIAPHLTVPEREKFLGIEGIHSFNDHVARKVAGERGIHSLTGMQSMQWNEERHQRFEQNSRYGEKTEHFSGAGKAPHAEQTHGQFDMFNGTTVHNPPPERPKAPAAADVHDNEMTAKDHYAANAIAGRVSAKRGRERIEGMRSEMNQTLDQHLASAKTHPVHGVIFPSHPKYHEAV